MRLTKQRASLIDELLKPNHYLLSRDSSYLSKRHREDYLCGTCVITLKGKKEVFVSKTQWQPAQALLDAGLIEFDRDLDRNGKLYRATGKSLAVKKAPKERAKKPKEKRSIFLEELKCIAAEYGCKFKFNRTHKWYELTRLDGTKLSNPYIAYTPKGKPVMKQSDLSRSEWINAIIVQSEYKQEQEQVCEQAEQAEQEQAESSTSS